MWLRRLLILVTFFTFVLLPSLIAQPCKLSKQELQVQSQLQHNYELAVEIQDSSFLLHTLLQLYQLCPTDTINSGLLLSAYYNSGNFNSCFLLAKKLTNQPTSVLSQLRFLALSAEKTERYTDAMNAYEKLYYLSGNSMFLYDISSLQYKLGRYAEANNSLIKMLRDPGVKYYNMMVNSGDGVIQTIDLFSVALNLRGLVLIELGDKQNALKSFNDAIALSPDFHLALLNKKSFLDKFMNGVE